MPRNRSRSVKELFAEKRDVWSECEDARDACERKAVEAKEGTKAQQKG
jgi:hypothetical protein